MQQIEYSSIDLDLIEEGALFTDMLNGMGKQGWQLCGILDDETLIFSRLTTEQVKGPEQRTGLTELIDAGWNPLAGIEPCDGITLTGVDEAS